MFDSFCSKKFGLAYLYSGLNVDSYAESHLESLSPSLEELSYFPRNEQAVLDVNYFLKSVICVLDFFEVLLSILN